MARASAADMTTKKRGNGATDAEALLGPCVLDPGVSLVRHGRGAAACAAREELG
jgi:hypothetical protein